MKSKLNYNQKYYLKNKEKFKAYNKEYYKRFPWKQTLLDIKSRCNNQKNKRYKNYGGRGIKCLITEEELKKLWFRDKAWKLKKHSINRKDNDGNYTYKNCEYIEMGQNSAERNVRVSSKPVLQYSLDGRFIKEYPSIISSADYITTKASNITSCCKGKGKTAYGFIWRYK